MDRIGDTLRIITANHGLLRGASNADKPANAIPADGGRSKYFARRPRKQRKDSERTRLELDAIRARNYGLTPEDLSAMMRAQDGRCYICDRIETVRKRPGQTVEWKPLSIDHCHITGRVRKLLCRSCNTALGQIEKNAHLLQKMLDYIVEHRTP